jgi:hypothetical protein
VNGTNYSGLSDQNALKSSRQDVVIEKRLDVYGLRERRRWDSNPASPNGDTEARKDLNNLIITLISGGEMLPEAQ